MQNPILIPLLLAHVLGDFVFQPKKWVEDRQTHKWKSKSLWWHALVHGALVFLLLFLHPQHSTFQLCLLPPCIAMLHALIDIWKSYRSSSTRYFILDQIAHVVSALALAALLDSISAQWLLSLFHWVQQPAIQLRLGFVILATFPTGLLVAKLTERFRKELPENESLAHAGMWIGVLERLLIMLFIGMGKFEAIGLLITAKSLLRFADKDNATGKRTEYILIGTLISFSTTVILGIVVEKLAPLCENIVVIPN